MRPGLALACGSHSLLSNLRLHLFPVARRATPVDLTCNVNSMSFIKTLFPLSLATSLAKIQACNTRNDNASQKKNKQKGSIAHIYISKNNPVIYIKEHYFY